MGIEKTDIRAKFEEDVYPAEIDIWNRNHVIDLEHAVIRAHIRNAYDDGTLLDIGGNWGVVLSEFPPQDLDQAIIIDLAREPLRVGNDSLPNIQYVQTDGTRVPFGDDVADLVVSSATIQYMENDQEFLQELRRLLKPGGSLVLGGPSKNHLKNAAIAYLTWRSSDPMFPFQEEAGPDDDLVGCIHHTGYSRDELTERLDTAGFEIERIDHVLHRCFGRSRSFEQIRLGNAILGLRPVNRLLSGTFVLTATLDF